MRLWPAKWWPREAWYRDPDDMLRVVGWGPFPLPGERKASRQRGDETRALRELWARPCTCTPLISCDRCERLASET